MKLAQARVALIEEPVFRNETLQTVKKLAEGTPMDVSVKNKGSARVPRLPIIITANYPFYTQGGSTERHAFRSRMIHYKLTQPAPFLKMTKRHLNPAMWQYLWAHKISPDITKESSSDEGEFSEFLAAATSKYKTPTNDAPKRKTPDAPKKAPTKRTLAFMDEVESICKSDSEEEVTDIDLLCSEDMTQMP